MKKIIIIGVICLFVGMCFQPAFANDISIGIVEQQPFDGALNNNFKGTKMLKMCVQQTKDAGYIIASYTETYKNPSHPLDIWLIKTDSMGNIVWDKTFGGHDFNVGWYVQQTNDDGYIILGDSSYYDVWLIKTDSNGNMVWDKTFEGENYNSGFCVQQTSDDGFIITGRKDYIYSEQTGNVWLIKTNSTGNMEWNRTFGGPNLDYGNCVQQTSDGGYIIIGDTESFGTGEEDVWLIKTDSNGSMEWDKTFGGIEWDSGKFVQQTTDGGYIITGHTYSFSDVKHDIWLIKTNSTGDIVWDKTFGGDSGEYGNCVQQTTDGGYIITGYTSSFGADEYGDVWLIKTDSNGNMTWDKIFGGLTFNSGHFVQQTIDKGYIITGGSIDYTWLIKTDSAGNKEWSKILERKSKTITGNMLLLRILERFPLLQEVISWLNAR
jgi:hypothetical protein